MRNLSMLAAAVAAAGLMTACGQSADDTDGSRSTGAEQGANGEETTDAAPTTAERTGPPPELNEGLLSRPDLSVYDAQELQDEFDSRNGPGRVVTEPSICGSLPSPVDFAFAAPPDVAVGLFAIDLASSTDATFEIREVISRGIGADRTDLTPLRDALSECPDYSVMSEIPGRDRTHSQSALDIGDLGDDVFAQRLVLTFQDGSGTEVHLTAVIVDADRVIAIEASAGSAERGAEPDVDAFIALVQEAYEFQHDVFGD